MSETPIKREIIATPPEGCNPIAEAEMAVMFTRAPVWVWGKSLNKQTIDVSGKTDEEIEQTMRDLRNQGYTVALSDQDKE